MYLKLFLALWILIPIVTSAKTRNKIIQIADWNEYRFMASLHFGKTNCSGTVISSRWVLTAAHCIPTKPKKGWIFLGDAANNLTQAFINSDFYTSTLQIIHAKYISIPVILNDIAMVKITGPAGKLNLGEYDIPLSNIITRVDISKKHIDDEVVCKVVDWDLFKPFQLPHVNEINKLHPLRQLHNLDIETTPHRSCDSSLNLFWQWNPNLAKQYIWGVCRRKCDFPAGIQTGFGGPLMYGEDQVGIVLSAVKFKEGACTKFLRIATYVPWMKHVMDKYNDAIGTNFGEVILENER